MSEFVVCNSVKVLTLHECTSVGQAEELGGTEGQSTQQHPELSARVSSCTVGTHTHARTHIGSCWAVGAELRAEGISDVSRLCRAAPEDADARRRRPPPPHMRGASS